MAEIRVQDIDLDNGLKAMLAARMLLDTDYPAVPHDLRADYLAHINDVLHLSPGFVTVMAARGAGTSVEHLRCRLASAQGYPHQAVLDNSTGNPDAADSQELAQQRAAGRGRAADNENWRDAT